MGEFQDSNSRPEASSLSDDRDRSPKLFSQIVFSGEFRIDLNTFHLRFIQLDLIVVGWRQQFQKFIDP